ncbi:MAG: UDP-N-acetylglucosamine 4,6-dehydratase (inverting) [Bacteroidales bacterium]|nr:UDP-N-acetylglucosamine 4,6-dehydratase (inverting) [Bacteroidales bacterium]
MLTDKTILVTGGTGSFGRKFVEVVLKDFKPKKIIVFSRDELKQHQMRQVFPDGPNSPVRYFIGDVREYERLKRAFHGVNIVVHAAALKQVPACEYNPIEAIKTNIEGTKNVIDAAIDCGVEKVMTISTDKAVNPINLYGATKLCAEKLTIQSNAYSPGITKLSCTRYGNVIGSRGSVVPLFLKQRDTGKITVTDKRMTRFWITIEQGVRFVIKCIHMMNGGEIFVPKLPSTNIMTIAEAIAPGCEIEFVGIRPGEKINEVLISEDESRYTIEIDDMYIIQPAFQWWSMPKYANAKKVPEGFKYSSDSNSYQLTIEEVRNLIKSIEL